MGTDIENKPLYYVTLQDNQYVIKTKEKLNGNEVFVDRTKISEAKKKEIISALPYIEGYKYTFRGCTIYISKLYKKDRKKRSVTDYQKKQGKKLERELRRSNQILTVGEKIKIIRLKKGLRLRDLAEKAGVFYLTIHQLEAGAVLTRKPQFDKICECLDISEEDADNLYIELRLEFARKRV